MTPEEKLQWNVNRNSNISIQGIKFENAVLKMAAILSRPQQVNKLRPRQNCSHFADIIFKCIFVNGSIWITWANDDSVQWRIYALLGLNEQQGQISKYLEIRVTMFYIMKTSCGFALSVWNVYVNVHDYFEYQYQLDITKSEVIWNTAKT